MADDLGEKLDKLAQSILDSVLSPGDGEAVASFDVRLDAMKTVGNYYLSTRKLNKSKLPDEGNGSSFTDFKQSIRDAEAEGTA